MATAINYNAFYSDYSGIASCLQAISQAELDGLLSDYADILAMLRQLEIDLLKKLYIRSIYTLAEVDHIDTVENGVPDDYFYGDFGEDDFIYDDFYVGYVDTGSTRYDAIFRSILNIFAEIIGQQATLSQTQLDQLNAALIAFLEYFRSIQGALAAHGLDLCGNLQQNSPYNNSTGVYLQAAGSEGLQGIVPGIHLRWTFTDELGYYHLPKGDYFNGSSTPLIAYNQKNDFVRVYRTAYQPGTPLHLDLYTAIPVVDFQQKSWLYTINITGGQQPRTDYIRFIFEDRAAYDLLSRQMNLGTGAVSRFRTFINAYPGVLRIQVIGATCYRISAQVSNPSTTTQPVKLESISGMDVTAAYDIENDFVSYQTALIPAEDNEHIVLTAENIKYIRLKKAALLELETLELETYATLLEPIDPQDWQEIGSGFSLTMDDNTAFDRLESTGKSIDNLWPHFNNGTRVRAANYRDKWSEDTQEAPSLASLVSSFLSLSATDPRAEEFHALETPIPGEIPGGITVSNLDMINLTSTDYHFARMLGLGYIDNDLPVQNEHYIYQLRYSNKKSMASGEIVTYTYTSLPTSMSDTRLPQKPSMRPLTYTFSDTESSVNDMLDEHGYSSIDPMRVINIGRQKEYAEQQGSSFFADMNSVINHNIFLSAKPVNYGIAYRKSTDIHYVKPEITTYTTDPDETPYYAYDDDHPQGILEPVPVQDNPESLYVHFVWENGFHHYAIYAIDWFFRASERSEEKHTDETTIIPVARLEPPTNIRVQYIQPEEPLVFTTGIEQSWIQGRLQQFPGQDVGLTRVTFDWKDIVDVTSVDTESPAELADVSRADQARAFFLDRLPIELAGRIVRVSAVTGDSRLARLHTGPYTLIDGTTVAPLLEPQDYARFVGSILATQDEIYRVQHIQNGAQGPDIIVEKRLVENVVSDEIIDILKGVERLRIAPEAGQRFTLVENLGEVTNWNPLSSTVALHSFADAQDPEIEILVDPEGNETRFWIGGITRQATVVPLWNDGRPPEQELPGFYQVTLENYTLPPHPQSNIPYDENNPNANAPGALRTPHVEWYKGMIRMPLSADPAGEMKEVEVLRIESLDPVELYIMDPDYATNPIYVPAQPQERVKVNFHPGYQAYFFTEPSPGLFNRVHIEPTGGENDRKTLLAFQSRDTSISSKLSTLSMPATLLALYLQEPQPIETPYISTNRVRPDATKQASFTFDIKVDPDAGGQSRSPFGFMFYRTDHGEILNALYKPATVSQILDDLSALTDDPFYDQRYTELARLVFDPDNPGHFKVYAAEPQAYGFPVPDKDLLTNPGDPLPVRIEKYRESIASTLMPLTEQPPIFAYIKEGYYTENAIPVIRDRDGKLLDVADSRFNPFPMIRKFRKAGQPNTWYVRFTDYHLGGNSRQLYFYAAVEINNRLQPGVRSPFTEAVGVLQTLPGEAPQVSAYEIQMDTNFEAIPAMVYFHLSPLSIDDRISRIRLYRFDSLQDTDSTAYSSSQADYLLGEFNPEGYTVTDTFGDLEVFPYYGKNVYYRLAGIRMIRNENNEPEEVLSLLSDVLEIPIADSKHPGSPILVYEDNGSRLIWQPVGQDYIYRLYRQNATGNWNNVREVHPPETNQTMEYPVGTLPEYDEDGDRVYHRFKISVESTLGQLNLQENEIVI